MLPKLLTAKEVKNYLHIGDDALYRLLKEKSFPSFQISSGEYKIIEEDFIEWMRQKSKKQTSYRVNKS